jgi:hypothetical protein
MTPTSLFTGSTKLPSVYNNKNDGSVTHTLSASTEAGHGFQKVLTIQTIGTTASPGRGGFYVTQTPAIGTTYTHTIRVKAPVGTKLNIAHNTITGVSGSTGQGIKWLTSNTGTDKWETYAYELTVPATATALGTFGHIYLTGGNSDKVFW